MRLTSPGDEALRWVGGLYYADIDRDVVVSQGSDLEPGPLGQGVRADERPEPDRPAVRRHVQQQRLRGLRPARLRRDRQRRTRARAALRQRGARREQQRARPAARARPTGCRAQTPLLQLRLEPVHQPGLHGEPGLRDRRHPGPQQDLRAAAAEAVGQLEADTKTSRSSRPTASGSAAAASTPRAAQATINQYFGNALCYLADGVARTSRT